MEPRKLRKIFGIITLVAFAGLFFSNYSLAWDLAPTIKGVVYLSGSPIPNVYVTVTNQSTSEQVNSSAWPTGSDGKYKTVFAEQAGAYWDIEATLAECSAFATVWHPGTETEIIKDIEINCE